MIPIFLRDIDHENIVQLIILYCVFKFFYHHVFSKPPCVSSEILIDIVLINQVIELRA